MFDFNNMDMALIINLFIYTLPPKTIWGCFKNTYKEDK